MTLSNKNKCTYENKSDYLITEDIVFPPLCDILGLVKNNLSIRRLTAHFRKQTYFSVCARICVLILV